MLRVPFISLALVLAVVACGKKQPVDEAAAKGAAGLPDVKVPAPSAIGEPPKETRPAEPLPAPASLIPMAFQGRGGLSPADCISAHGNGKGLLVVTPEGLDFHESRAVPAADVETDGNSIGGNFA